MSIYIVSFYGCVFACDLCLYICTCTSNLSPLQRPCTASDPGSYAYCANLKIEVRAEFLLSYNTICCFIGTVPSSCLTEHLPSNQNYYLSHYLVICNWKHTVITIQLIKIANLVKTVCINKEGSTMSDSIVKIERIFEEQCKREVNCTLIFAGWPLMSTLSKSFVSGFVEHLQNALLSVLEWHCFLKG